MRRRDYFGAKRKYHDHILKEVKILSVYWLPTPSPTAPSAPSKAVDRNQIDIIETNLLWRSQHKDFGKETISSQGKKEKGLNSKYGTQLVNSYTEKCSRFAANPPKSKKIHSRTLLGSTDFINKADKNYSHNLRRRVRADENESYDENKSKKSRQYTSYFFSIFSNDCIR